MTEPVAASSGASAGYLCMECGKLFESKEARKAHTCGEITTKVETEEVAAEDALATSLEKPTYDQQNLIWVHRKWYARVYRPVLLLTDCLCSIEYSPEVWESKWDENDVPLEYHQVFHAIKRGQQLRCLHCALPGATIGCW